MRPHLDGDGNHLDAIRAGCRPRLSSAFWETRCHRCGKAKAFFGGTRINNRFVCAECRAKGQRHV